MTRATRAGIAKGAVSKVDGCNEDGVCDGGSKRGGR